MSETTELLNSQQISRNAIETFRRRPLEESYHIRVHPQEDIKTAALIESLV